MAYGGEWLMRRMIYNILKGSNLEVYAPGQLTAPSKIPYVVVKMGTTTVEGCVRAYTPVDIMCYVPDTSIFGLDDLVEKVKSVIREHELTDEFSGINGDYHDTQLEAYMTVVKFRIPHTIK